MFGKSARFYDSLYHFKDYAAATEKLHRIIQKYNPQAKTLLDVACGTGKHLEHLLKNYDVQGLDLNEELLDIAQSRCPGIFFHHGNMIDFELQNRYDVITCLFSSIAYVQTAQNMRRTIHNFRRHLKPGGMIILEPFFSPENYWEDRVTANFVDQKDLKIAWMYISRRRGNLGVLDIHYLVGSPEGFECFQERHELGLYTAEEYLEAFYSAGLVTDFDPEGLFGRGMYIGMFL
jgi:ubiquinone/menaquinone biosynthesis C-methylase UbiE